MAMNDVHPRSEMEDHRSQISAYPPDITFNDLIARNKRNTVLLTIGMGVLAVVVVEVIALAIMAYVGHNGQPGDAGSPFSIEGLILAGIAAMAVVLLSTTWSYFQGGKTILSISGARPIEKKDDPQLFNVVEELSIAAGLPMPRIYLMDEPALNAFATGRDPHHASVAITTGLRRKLTRDELQGVMAHEMSHVRHYDIRLTMMVATMVGLIVLACDMFLRMAFYAPRTRSRDSKGGGGAAVLMIIALLLAVIAPIFATIIQFAISRQREYLADAGAVELTRNPQGLASALATLAADTTPLQHANRATAHLFIVNPHLNAKGRENVDSVFSTHPPIRDRIARILALLR